MSLYLIPNLHASTLTLEILKSICKKLAAASGAENYNILQNNGKLAHQVVPHVHFHMIPKPDESHGLGIGWPAQSVEQPELKKLADELRSKM